MTDSIRQQIMSKIDTRMKTILMTGGYQTDVGANVHDWLSEPPSEDDLPILTYKDSSVSSAVNSLAPSFLHDMAIVIQVAVEGSTPMTTIRKIIADIDRAIGVDDTWDGLALMTTRIGDESEVEIGGKTFAGCQINMVVSFRTLGWNDYVKL